MGTGACTSVCVCVEIYIYCLPGDNGRLQYLMGVWNGVRVILYILVFAVSHSASYEGC